MLVKNLLMTCWSCLNGHRASNCHHPTRPLYALKNKGRPRPQTLSRSKDNPDVMSIDDPGFTLFHEYIMNDPILRKEYFHADEAKSPKKRAAAPYAVKRGRSRSGGSTVDIYAGKCSAEEVFRWRELCGVVDVSFNGDGTNFWMPVWPTAGSMPMTSCSTMNTSPISAMKTGLTNTDNVVSLMNTMTTENVLDNNILSPSPEAFNHSGLFNRATSFSPGTFNKHTPILDYTQLNINAPCQPDDLSLNSPIIPLDSPSFVESQLSFKEAENSRSEFLLPSPWESELDSPLSTTDTSLFSELFGDDMEIPSDMAMKLDTNEFNFFMDFESTLIESY